LRRANHRPRCISARENDHARASHRYIRGRDVGPSASSFDEERKLSIPIIDNTVGLPCSLTYLKHFGSLRNVYRLIGYDETLYWDRLEVHKRWANLNAGNAALLRERFEKLGYRPTFDPAMECLRVKGAGSICFRMARWMPLKRENHSPRWALRRRAQSPAGWMVAMRLGKHNKEVLDYLLLPSTSFHGVWLRFSEKARRAHKIESFESFEDLARSLVRRVSKAPRSIQPKRQRSKAIVSDSRNGRRSRASQ
jgi:hypothetical protein